MGCEVGGAALFGAHCCCPLGDPYICCAMLEDCNGDEGRYTSPVRCVAGGRAGWLAGWLRCVGCDASDAMRCDATRRAGDARASGLQINTGRQVQAGLAAAVAAAAAATIMHVGVQ